MASSAAGTRPDVTQSITRQCDEVDAWTERHGRFPRQRGPVAGEDALARRYQVLKRALKNDPDSFTTAMAQRIAATTLVESRVRVAANLAEAERRWDAKRLVVTQFITQLCGQVEAFASQHRRFPRQRGPRYLEDRLARRYQELKRAFKKDPDSFTTAGAQRIAATILEESRDRVAAKLAEAERRRDAKRARVAANLEEAERRRERRRDAEFPYPYIRPRSHTEEMRQLRDYGDCNDNP